MRNTVLLLIVLFQTILSTAQTKKFLVPYRQGNKWGFCDTLGKVVIQPKYDSTDFFGERGFANGSVGRIFSSKGTGLISFTGRLIVPAEYDDVFEMNTHYIVQKKNKQGLYHSNGKLVVPIQYDGVDAADYYSKELFRLTLGEKNGLYNAKLNKTIPAVYDIITSTFFSEKVDNQKWLYARKGDQKFLIDKEIFKIVPYKGSENLEDMGELESIPMQEMLEEGVKEETEKIIKEKIGADEVVKYKNGENSYAISESVYIVKKNSKSGLYFASQSILLSPEYDSISYALNIYNSNYLKYKSSFLIAVKKGDRFGIVNEKGEEILPFQYDHVSALAEYLYAFTLISGNKKGIFMPHTFYPVIQTKYESINYYTSLSIDNNWSFVIFKVVKNGKAGFVGENGVEYFK